MVDLDCGSRNSDGFYDPYGAHCVMHHAVQTLVDFYDFRPDDDEPGADAVADSILGARPRERPYRASIPSSRSTTIPPSPAHAASATAMGVPIGPFPTDERKNAQTVSPKISPKMSASAV
jgi:hypothetical protein